MNITPELKAKLKEIAPTLLEDKDLPLFLKLEEIADALKVISEKEMPEMEMPEHPEVQKISMEGVSVMTLKGDKGDTGEKGESIVGPRGPKGDKGDSIVGPMGPAGRDGESIVGPAGKDGKDGSPDSPEQVKAKLLQAGLTIDDVEDLRKELDDLKKKWASRPMFGGGGLSVSALNMHFYHDEVGTGDDVTTVFTLDHTPSPSNSLEVWIGAANVWLTDDYTLSGSQVTFLTAPPNGAKIRAKYRI